MNTIHGFSPHGRSVRDGARDGSNEGLQCRLDTGFGGFGVRAASSGLLRQNFETIGVHGVVKRLQHSSPYGSFDRPHYRVSSHHVLKIKDQIALMSSCASELKKHVPNLSRARRSRLRECAFGSQWENQRESTGKCGSSFAKLVFGGALRHVQPGKFFCNHACVLCVGCGGTGVVVTVVECHPFYTVVFCGRVRLRRSSGVLQHATCFPHISYVVRGISVDGAKQTPRSFVLRNDRIVQYFLLKRLHGV